MATTNNGKDGGLLKGKPHYDKNGKSLGGIKAIVTDTKQMVELEGGEVIINKEASKKHWKELSKINQSAGNGVPILPPDNTMADTEEYKNGGRTIEFNPNQIPNKWVYDYAKKIKDKHPKIWALGGNEFGNTAFENLERALKRGYWTENEEWMYVKWQSFNARHRGDFRIAGVIANLKWLNKVDKGWDFMKHLIESEIKKRENKLETGGELAKGIKSEREHIGTANKLYKHEITPKQAPESIAKEHLAEDSKYYTKLEEFESKFDTGGGVEQKPVFEFMKSNPMQQARAVSSLEKRINADGKIIKIHEWIESFEKGLEVATSKLHSSKSEKGYVEKLVIGDNIVYTKAEQDYYKYIENGGESYTSYLIKLKAYTNKLAEKSNIEREETKKIREQEAKLQKEASLKGKNEQIKMFIEKGKDAVLEVVLSKYVKAIENLKNERKSKSNDEEIAFNEKMIAQRTDSVNESYIIATSLYKIVDGEVEKKYDWKVGDKVLYAFGKIEPIETVIIDIVENGSFKVEKREGIYNQYISYDGLLPLKNEPEEQTLTFFKTLIGKKIKKGTGEYATIGKIIDVDSLNGDKINNNGIFIYFLEDGENVADKIKVNEYEIDKYKNSIIEEVNAENTEPEEQKPTHKEFLVKYYINTGKKHNVKTYICAQNRNEAIDIAKKDDDRYTELISCKPTGNTSWSSSCNKDDAEFDENDEGADEEKHFDSNYKPIFWHLTQSEFCEYAENYEVDTRLDGTKARLECKDYYKYAVVLPLLDDSAERNVFLLAVETGLLPYEKVKEIIESVGAWKDSNRFVKELLEYDRVKNYGASIWLIPKDLYLSADYYKNNFTKTEANNQYARQIYKYAIEDDRQLREFLEKGIVKLKDIEARLIEANVTNDKFVDKLKVYAKKFSSKNKLKGLKLLLEDDSPDKKEHLGKLIDETVERLKKKYKNIENLSKIDINTVKNRKSVIDWVSNSKDVTVIIAFSGGKDSIALVLYALFELKIPKERIELWHHEVDGKGEQLFDWACTLSYCEAFAKAFDLKMYSSYAEGGILDAIYRQDAPPQSVFYQSEPEGKFNKITTKGSERFLNTRLKFPAVASDLNKRWCSSVVKIDVMSKVINNWDRFKKSKVCVMTGERRTESTNRAKYKEVDNSKNTKNKKLIQWRAIIDWDEKKVWDIIKKHKVQPHPCYELGWNRCSCQLCIFSSDNTWASINEINPEKVKRIAEIEKDLDAKGSAIVKAQTENPSLIKWGKNKKTGELEPKPFVNLPYLYGDKIKVEEFIPAHQTTTKTGKLRNIKGKVGKVWKGERADIYGSKVNKGVSYIPKELKERWSKEANGTFISPIIVDEWKLPIGAFKTEEGGAN